VFTPHLKPSGVQVHRFVKPALVECFRSADEMANELELDQTPQLALHDSENLAIAQRFVRTVCSQRRDQLDKTYEFACAALRARAQTIDRHNVKFTRQVLRFLAFYDRIIRIMEYVTQAYVDVANVPKAKFGECCPKVAKLLKRRQSFLEKKRKHS
jgi:hypothetical protein